MDNEHQHFLYLNGFVKAICLGFSSLSS